MNTGKILITGATGSTGGYAIEQLLEKGHEVRALVHRIDDRSRRLEDKICRGGRRRLPRPGRDADGGEGRPPGVLRLPDSPRDHSGDRLLRPGGQRGGGRGDREYVADLCPGRRPEQCRPGPLG